MRSEDQKEKREIRCLTVKKDFLLGGDKLILEDLRARRDNWVSEVT